MQRRAIIFERNMIGHYPDHIRGLLEYRLRTDRGGELILVVPSEFQNRHPDVHALAVQAMNHGVRCVPIAESDYDSIKRTPAPLQPWIIWKCIKKYARRVKADSIFLLSIDSFQLPLLLEREPPCSVSGIYFRPTFHYSTYKLTSGGISEQVVACSKARVIRRLLEQPWIQRVLTLDALAAAYMREEWGSSKVEPLAEPLRAFDASWGRPYARSAVGVQSERTALLLFGALTERKGLLAVLGALTVLSDELASKTCLLLTGWLEPRLRTRTAKAVEILRSRGMQVVCRWSYVGESDLNVLMSAADIVLAPYLRHKGSSGVLVRSAAAGRPVLGSSYGLLGWMIRKHRLGVAVNTESVRDLAEGLRYAICGGLLAHLDLGTAEAFARSNSVDAFAEAVFSAMDV